MHDTEASRIQSDAFEAEYNVLLERARMMRHLDDVPERLFLDLFARRTCRERSADTKRRARSAREDARETASPTLSSASNIPTSSDQDADLEAIRQQPAQRPKLVTWDKYRYVLSIPSRSRTPGNALLSAKVLAKALTKELAPTVEIESHAEAREARDVSIAARVAEVTAEQEEEAWASFREAFEGVMRDRGGECGGSGC
jgi:hypothetical protein